MLRALALHPDSRCDAVVGIEVEVARPRPDALVLRYVVTGKIDELHLPPVTAPVRADELWRHGCFEAFVRVMPRAAYTEINFAPSTQWAAYRFDGYREGMRIAGEIEPPHIEVQATAASFTLEAWLATHLASDAVWRLGLSAVIEETSGRKSYWALAHPPGKADFHHEDCFALELPQP